MDQNDLHSILKNHLKEQSEKWPHFIYSKEHGFYQGFDRIGIIGSRSTEKRFKEYNIENLLSKNKNVLDIGSNCGFVSLCTSESVKNVTGVELNPFLVKISNATKEFLNIQNVKFVCSTFEEYKTGEKFDIVYSFANDSTIDDNVMFNFEEYIQKILFLLSPDGLLIFESQALDVLVPSAFDLKLEILEKYFIIKERRTVHSEYPVNVSERIFLILEKK